jgi:hypothetical protein
MHKGNQAWVQINEEIAQDVHTGLLNFSWVHHEAVGQLRMLQSCRSCESHTFNCRTNELNIVDEGTNRSKSEESEENAMLMDVVDTCQFQPETQGSVISATSDEEGPTLDDEDMPLDPTFDDYASSPLQIQRQREDHSRIYSFDVDGVPLVSNSWFQWRDRGRRLPHKRFFQTVHTLQPSRDLNSALGFPPISKSKMKPSGISNSRVHEFSAAQLLDEAGNKPGDNQSKRTLIVGRERQCYGEDAAHFVLNLEMDAVTMEAADVGISIDLDSLIWVTTPVGFNAGDLNIHLSPSMASRAAISNNNFIRVTLMDAPQDEQEHQNPRLRGQRDVPLSQIPHIEFGFCGSGERRINSFIFFPRMIHKRQNGSRFSTLVPLCVQDLWYDKVIIPSCNKILTAQPGLSEYVPLSLGDIRKRTNYKQRSIFTLEPSRLVKEVQRRVIEGDELLSCFGSFFLVMDGRGMKVATKQCIGKGLTADQSGPTMETIKQSFQFLDWGRMVDRQHGELYLDIGMSYHPNSPEPLTGLWRIPSLQKSFEKMGSRLPTVYPLGTLAFYGGLKAEMTAKSKRNSHLVSRLSYCLAFETVRNPGVEEYLCSDKDIIDRTPKFRKSVQNWSELFLSAKSQSYGVRDEIRGISSIVLDFLPVSIEKVVFSFDSKQAFAQKDYIGKGCSLFSPNHLDKIIHLLLPPAAPTSGLSELT